MYILIDNVHDDINKHNLLLCFTDSVSSIEYIELLIIC